MFRALFLIFVLCIANLNSAFANEIIIGKPERRVIGVEDKKLTSAEQAEYSLKIVKSENGNYIWASREGKPLSKTQSGIYTIFTSPAGMVVLRPCFDDSTTTGIDFDSGCTEYGEHIRNGLDFISYFGKLEKSDLK